MRKLIASLRNLSRNRLLWSTVLVCFLFVLLARHLYTMQILNAEDYVEKIYEDVVEERTVGGARGNIYDCYGRPLAVNRTTKALYYKPDTSNADLNETLLSLMETLRNNHEELMIEDSLPIRYDSYSGFYYTDRYANPTGVARLNFLAEIFNSKRDDLTEEQAASTAEEAYIRMRDVTFEIDPELPLDTILELLNIRYEIFQYRWTPDEPILIAQNISEETQAIILEQSTKYKGFYVETAYTRYYPEGEIFSHIIGYVGRMNESELEELEDQGYTEQDRIGKTGLEASFEEQLRSSGGVVAVTYSGRTGERIKEETVTSAKKGNDLILTIDADFQRECYDILYQNIKRLLLEKINGVSDTSTNKAYSAMDIVSALITNGFFDFETIQESTNSGAMRFTGLFNQEADRVILELRPLMMDSDMLMKDYTEEQLDYLSYVISYMRSEGYLSNDYHNNDYEVYIRYLDGLTTAREFLDFCYNSGFFELEEFGLDGFTPAETGLPIIIDSMLEAIRHNTDYEQLVCTNILKDNLFSVQEFLSLCYDLGFLNNDDGLKDSYLQGSLSLLDLIRSKISSDEITPADINLDPCSGSMIVTDCDTGEVKAIVSYPSYDTNLFLNNLRYNQRVVRNQSSPMLFRALQEQRPPGSTYKMVTSAAALELGYIDTDYYVYDAHAYPNVNSEEMPTCWSETSHGYVNVIEALEHSCNYFFYDCGYRLCNPARDGSFNDDVGLAKMATYAETMGLSTNTGIELYEATPHVSTLDSVRSAIGQGSNAFTVANINRYTNTIANGGSVYDLYLVDRILDAEGNTVFEKDSEPVSKADVSEENLDIIKQGLRLVNTREQADTLGVLDSLGITTAGKTGTAEESEAHPEHSWYTGYTNVDDPEISITINIPFGGGSSEAIPTFIDTVEAYYLIEAPEDNNNTE